MNIRSIQLRLIALGYGVGGAGADGVLGRSTIAAVNKFQLDQKLYIQFPGTIGPKTIDALNSAAGARGQPAITGTIEPPWFLEAMRRINLQEVRDNKKLREYLDSDGHTLGDPAKLPWCGDFQETVIAVTLPREPMVTNPYYALNWKGFGVAVPSGMVPLGAIAPFSRQGGGHIGQIAGHDKDYFHVLGGNEGNKVAIVRMAKSRLAGPLRWPATYALPTVSLKFSTIDATISTNEA